jgi:transposase
VRAREAAKQDQMRARHRLSKFLLRSGQRPPSGVRPWTRPYLIWVAQLRFTQLAQEATRLDYLHEVEHMRERVARLEQAITEAVKLASPALQQVINDLQALRGIADISAVTIAAELGQVSRFESARQLMGYCGAVPSEDSSGKRIRRGGIRKTGNAHLRRIVVEAAWSYRRPPGVLAYATGSTGLAITVGGSSRRIMIMRSRPANTRLINRRSNLPRLLLALSSGNNKSNDENNPTVAQS